MELVHVSSVVNKDRFLTFVNVEMIHNFRKRSFCFTPTEACITKLHASLLSTDICYFCTVDYVRKAPARLCQAVVLVVDNLFSTLVSVVYFGYKYYRPNRAVLFDF